MQVLVFITPRNSGVDKLVPGLLVAQLDDLFFLYLPWISVLIIQITKKYSICSAVLVQAWVASTFVQFKQYLFCDLISWLMLSIVYRNNAQKWPVHATSNCSGFPLSVGGNYGLINRGFTGVERMGLGISRVFCALGTQPGSRPNACVPRVRGAGPALPCMPTHPLLEPDRLCVIK